jgi:ankyrin repeat protein
VDVMSEEDLAIQNKYGNTALVYAITAGNWRMTACLLGKNNKLVSTKDSNSDIPANKASFNGHTELARYLYSLTPLEDLTEGKGVNGATLCTWAIYNRCLGNNLSLTIHRSLFLMI